MFFKLIIILMLLIILISLFSGLFFINRDADAVQSKGRNLRAVRALTVRIAVSLILFAALIVSYHLGWFGH